MQNFFKSIFVLMVATTAALGFVACNEDENENVAVSLEGKWVLLSENYKELMIIDANHSVIRTGADAEQVWMSVAGSIALDGDNFTLTSNDNTKISGTFKVTGSQLTLTYEGHDRTYNKMAKDFSMVGQWECANSISFVKAVKDEIQLPIGSIINGEEILPTIPTAQVKGEFVEMAISKYFRNVEFKSNGEFTYNVEKEGEEMTMTKNYTLDNNILTVTGKVGSIDIHNRFMAFQGSNQQESFLFMTKENIADMFVGYGLMLREGNVSEGTNESLEDFKQEFMEAFENFAVIITLQKK